MQIPAADRFLALIGYLPMLPFFLLPVKLRKTSLFAQFHGRQAGVLWALWLAIVIVVFVVLLVLGTPDTLVGVLLFGVVYVATGLYFVLSLIAIIKVLLGERYRMPVVADVALALKL